MQLGKIWGNINIYLFFLSQINVRKTYLKIDLGLIDLYLSSKNHAWKKA